MGSTQITSLVAEPDPPLVTVLISTYNAERLIQGALESLEQQTIANRIEIIVIDSGSTQDEKRIVEQFQSRYDNIRYLRTARESVYQAWNRGIQVARGLYLTNANTDDRHRADALEVLADELNRNTDIALVYANSAVTLEGNQTFDAAIPSGYHLRPAYAPNIMLTGCHMGPQPMWRRSIHEELGYFREDLRSAGDYEFWCRVALRHNFLHVPQTLGLYFENPRGICNSDKTLSASESRTVMMQYQGLLPEPEPQPVETCKRPKVGTMFVNIGMVTFNRLEFTRQSIASVIKYTDYPYVLTVVDNASQDGSREYLQQLQREGVIDNLILLPENVGVAKASNLAWHQEPQAAHYLKLDNDIVIRKPGWLGKMVRTIDQASRIGVLAYNFEPTSYPLVRVEELLVRAKPGNLGGACILIPRRTWELLGDWCEDYGLYGEEDGDYGLRVSLAGLLNVYMEDEDIGDHLPAGKAALISSWSRTATDGVEEHSEAEYRRWKDQQRDEHMKLLGVWEQNQFAYTSGQRPLWMSSEYVASRAGIGHAIQQNTGDRIKSGALVAQLVLRRFAATGKIARRLLSAASQNLRGVGVFTAVASAARSMRDGGLGALKLKALYFLNQTTNYSKWVDRYDQLKEEDCRQIAGQIEMMRFLPVFSVIMPVYNTELKHLEQAIASVSSQLYPHWELCIADDASDDPQIARLIQGYCEKDSRIKFARRLQRGHISAASNSCLEMARGEFVALLDHDDVLAPHALYMAARALNERPDLSLIYSDEDKIGNNGTRTWPHFKPDWNVDLMRSQNAVNHLGIYRTAVVREVGGFRIGVEGCQDWDLTLRVSEQITSSQIHHLPYVLYHWRIAPQSTALSTASKQYVADAGKKVLTDHLQRLGEHAHVVPLYGAYFRVQYRLDSPPSVAVISQVGSTTVLKRLVNSLTKGTDYPDLTLFLLTDAEEQRQLAEFVVDARSAGLNLVLLDCETDANLSARINRAIDSVKQSVICILDPECVPSSAGWLTEMVSHAMRPAIGAVGARLLRPNGTVFSAGTILGIGRNRISGATYAVSPRSERGAAGRAGLIQNYSAVSARCMVVRREVFLDARGLDPDLPLDDFGDVDFCLRLGALGYRIVWTPFAELVWNGSTSETREGVNAVSVMKARWNQKLVTDPAHNPNLSLDNPFPMLAPAPRVPHCSAYRPESVGM